ncbi:uncharacterized protein LOC131614751 [Vicia villosa]|uniref:uncharacterized protein LOC131614751 n=1 Tax=Vicia villosa TaxID=3911 RepID=UPI00273AD24B|nr:uncharacterized protein LOC131614751 [Vicia villosa]
MFNVKKDMADYKWEVGVYFRSKDDFKEAITSYAVQSETWQLSKLVDKHECSREYNVKILTTKWLRKRIQNSLKNNPRMKIKDINAKAQKRWNMGINKTKAIRERFKARDMVDGSLQKILAAIGRDPNDKMLPVAFAVVEGENRDSWTWFLQLLIDDLGGQEECLTYTFILDQQKGLLLAMDELLPGVEQRLCVRHLYNNFRKKYPGKMLKDAIWKAARSTYVQDWEREMRSMRLISDEAYLHMMKTSQRFWSKSHFKVTNKCDTLLNNMYETFNSVILESRMSDEHIFEVKHVQDPADMFIVNLKDHICSCRKWELSGLPCVHVLSCMNCRNFKFEDFIPEYYRKSRYIAVYKPIIYLVNCLNLWARTHYPDVHPPKYRKMPGRPKKKRNLEQGELDGTGRKIRRTCLIVKCNRCKKSGHKKATCKVTGLAQPTTQQTS